MGINELIQNFQNLDIIDILGDSFDETKLDLIEYQKGQMLRGLNRDGNRIGTYASPDYKRKKQNMNPLAEGFVDLKYKGEYQRNISVKIFRGSIQLFSTDYKNDLLIKKYSNSILGLNSVFAGEYSIIYLGPAANRRFILQITKLS